MSKLHVALMVACAGMGLCLTARASYLEEGDEATPPRPMPVRPIPPRPVPPPPPAPRPQRVAHNALTEAVLRISVGEPYAYGGLTVFPLEMRRLEDPTEYMSLDEALRRDDLVITEKGRGTVPRLLAQNTGRRPILLLGGEIIVGGKQNRILQEDVLLLARSGRVELPVLCVERGRWTGEHDAFKGKPSVAAFEVRALAQTGAAQEEVWIGVGRYQADLAASSASEDLSAIQDSEEALTAAKEYRRAFHDHWRPETVGMVVARYDRIVGADVFCNADVFRKHRDRILDSYAVDCYAVGKRRGHQRERWIPRPPRPGEAELFLERALSAHFGWGETPGAGRLLNVIGPGIRGGALVHRDALIHASLFAQDEAIIVPLQRRSGRELPDE